MQHPIANAVLAELIPGEALRFSDMQTQTAGGKVEQHLKLDTPWATL